MSARLLALEALKAMQAEASARNCGLRICDEAVVALLAETGEPVAWVDGSKKSTLPIYRGDE
jgi:hypothetical protein